MLEKEEHRIDQLKARISELESEIRTIRGHRSSTEDELKDIFESLQDIYFRCDLNGEITMLNPAVMELTGYDPQLIIHKNITNYYLYNPKVKDLIRRLIRDGQVRNFEASVVKNNGDILQCLCNIRLLHSKQGYQIEGVVRDITELKKVNAELLFAKELAERSLRVKEKFLANMSHEIRTPLNGIIGMIDLISATSLDEEQTEYIRTIKKSSEILLFILNDILEISKIEAGKVKIRKNTVDYPEVIGKIKDLFLQEARRNDLEFRIDLDKNMPRFLVLDETRFIQILSNLISNAIKFTDRGGRIELILRSESNTSPCGILVEVRDTGIGISGELLGSLFNSFSQLDNSLTKKYSGTGLGLAISQELCRLMGSEIQVESSPGKGSRFWFYLESEIARDVPTFRTEKSDVENVPVLSGSPKILLVDDNKINRDVARHILVRAKSEVTEADSGEKAVQLARNEDFNLIILDIQMPGLDGIETMKQIREQGTEDLPPIIAMTAYAMEEDESRFLEHGFDGYIAKPIRAASFVNKVSGWLSLGPVSASRYRLTGQAVKESVLNSDIVESLRSIGGEALIRETYQEFEEESSEIIHGINNALIKADYTGILSKLHTLKGNAGTLGVERLHAISAKIENNIKNDDFSTIENDMKLLNAIFKEYKEKYKVILKFR